MSAKSIIQVAITDDHPMILDGFKLLFQDLTEYQVHSFSNRIELLSHLQINNLDIVLLDINLADGNGLEICTEIKQLYPSTHLIGFSNQTEQSIILQFLQNGGSGYILKNANRSEILKQINKAYLGEIALCSETLQIITSSIPKELVPRLTKREKQILKAIADAHTSAQIAEQLFISVVTVETHRRNLLQKFKAKNTVELIRKAITLKMI